LPSALMVPGVELTGGCYKMNVLKYHKDDRKITKRLLGRVNKSKSRAKCKEIGKDCLQVITSNRGQRRAIEKIEQC
jgi:hypothetical protein